MANVQRVAHGGRASELQGCDRYLVHNIINNVRAKKERVGQGDEMDYSVESDHGCSFGMNLSSRADASGTVKVRTSATSVTFTVLPNDYFDAPGSTIRFQVVHQNDGFYLDQVARASRSDLVVTAGVGAGIVNIPWETQAANLRQAILKYGRKG
jgi:hypothetical protein